MIKYRSVLSADEKGFEVFPMPLPLQYQIHETETAIYLCLEGDLDDKNFLAVSRSLSDINLELPVKVDLKKVRYADSTGLRSLVLLQRQAREAGVDFTLLDPSESVERIFRTTGLDQVFNVSTQDPQDPCCTDAAP